MDKTAAADPALSKEDVLHPAFPVVCLCSTSKWEVIRI